MPRPTRILIGDNEPLLRLGLAALIERQPGWKVCGEAADGGVLHKLNVDTRPDLVVTDFALEGASGLEMIGALRKRRPDARILVFSHYDEVFFAERAVREGASGYVMKREPAATLVRAIRHVLKGGIYVTLRATGSILHKLAGHQEEPASPLQPLSDRELEVLRRMGEGYLSRDIARDLHVSIKTVEAHREHIKSKLGVGPGSELLRLAIQWVQAAQVGKVPSRRS